MKIVIVDDEKKETDLISGYIDKISAKIGEMIVKEVYHSPARFLDEYNYDADLIFLDVEMPGLNGIEAARELRRKDQNVVIMFITNMAQYAICGYEVEAVDYILKPVSYQDFALKMQKAMRYILQNKDTRLTLTTTDGTKIVGVSDVFFVEVNRHYLIYHTVIGEMTVRGTMKEAEELLKPYHFVRCNHSFLVNLKYVEAVNGVELKCADHTLLISRNKKTEFMYEFTRYISGCPTEN